MNKTLRYIIIYDLVIIVGLFVLVGVVAALEAYKHVTVTASVAPHYECIPDHNTLYVNTNMEVIINDD